VNEVVFDMLVTEDEVEALLLLAFVASEVVVALVVALVELDDVTDGVILVVLVVTVIVVGELVVTLADFDVVVRLDIVPLDV
jgi:hypothetical protein